MKLHALFLGVLGAVCLASAAEPNLDRTFQVQPGGKLVIQADRGSIKVDTHAPDTVHVRVLRQVKGGSQKEAGDLLANHEVTLTQDGNTVTVTARDKRRSNWHFNLGRRPWLDVHYEISIPRKFNVELKTAGGDIDVEPLDGTALAHTTSGSIRLPNVSGDIDAKDAGGNVSLGQAGANVKASTTSGYIQLTQAAGQADLSDAGGNIHVDEAGSDLIARTTSGSIDLGTIKSAVKVSNAGGDLDAQTTSGSVQVTTVKGHNARISNAGGNITVGSTTGDLTLQTTSGSIRVESAGGSVQATDAGGNISFGHVGGDAKIRTTSGNINVDLTRGSLTAHNAGGGIRVGSVYGPASAETSSGSIDVNFATAPKSDSHLTVAGGGISVGLPASAAIDLDAKASGGDVSSDLPLTVTVQGRHISGALVGKINGGGPALVLRSSSGNIHLKKSATAPQPASAPIKLED